jgi:hypothetical protein
MTLSTKSAFLSYIHHGLPVLGIKRADKRPITPNGVYGATLDRKIALSWPDDLNVAVATGAASGTAVLDIDARNGGFITLAEWSLLHGELPETVMDVSGGAGEHHWFAMPELQAGQSLRYKLGPGIELLATNRYVVVPPSLHETGRRYRWARSPWQHDFQPMPKWLLEKAVVQAPPVARHANSVQFKADSEIIDRARAYLSKCPPAIQGKGGSSHTFSVVQRIVRGFGLSEADALPLLQEWNRTCIPRWSDPELLRKCREASAKGRFELGKLR